MRIVLVTPAPAGSHAGNRATARRWAGILRGLGHRVGVKQEWRDEPCDILLALHARKSFRSIERFRRAFPARPLIVALTGTDLYGDLRRSRRARKALELADRIVLLQPRGRAELPPFARRKVRVIHQSAARRKRGSLRAGRSFDVCVLAHLRPVKDPFRAALASRLLPADSRIRILQAGAALAPRAEKNARREEKRNPRYRWLGDLSGARALQVLARSRLLVNSSRIEGGANVVSEALACGVPLLATRIAGNVGVLGPGYPGYFEVGDTRRLAALMHRAESDAAWLSRLEAWCRRRRHLVDPLRETRAWNGLLRDLHESKVGARRARLS
jgi:putative glycosyltransferase (TIGR04348 family)